MKEYFYKAKKGPEHIQEGQIQACSQKEAIAQLDLLGLYPLLIKEKTIAAPKRVTASRKEVVKFSLRLATLINSGLTLLAALQTLCSGMQRSPLKRVLEDIIGQIKDGKGFSAALGQYPRIFSQFYVALVMVGEKSGTLGQNLKRVAEFLEEELDFRTSLRAALIYPLFICAVGVLTVIVLLKFVIPKLTVIFEDMGQALPLATHILMKIASGFEHYWFLFIGAGFGLVFFGKQYVKTAGHRLQCNKLQLTIPVWGELFRKIEVCRFSRTMALLLRNSVSLDEALEIVKTTTGNLFFRQAIEMIGEKIRNGASLYGVMMKSGMFDADFISAVKVGEETARLDEVLESLANDYDKEINRKIKRFIGLLEPFLILIVGMVVGFVVFSMLLPIFQIDFNF